MMLRRAQGRREPQAACRNCSPAVLFLRFDRDAAEPAASLSGKGSTAAHGQVAVKKMAPTTTHGAAIAMALLAIIVLALIVLLAWPTHSASDSSVGADDLAGMVDRRVSQANIQDTICRRGYTRTVRPPRDVTDAIKRNLPADQGVSVGDYELDHVVSLDLGGSPLDLRNLRLQPWAGACNAHMKDDLERQLAIMVCAGDVTLNGAQLR
jgi:hypothetical protein